MALHERNRAATVYHAIVAILLLVGGGGLIAFGIWLRSADHGAPTELLYNGSFGRLNLALNAPWIALGAGGFLILAGALALLALGRRCAGATFRVLYVLLAVIVAAVLLALCVVAALSAHNRRSVGVRSVLELAWSATAATAPTEICRLEKRFQCRGFYDRQCTFCPTGQETTGDCAVAPVCVPCGPGARSADGCYDEIMDELRRVFTPVAAISGTLAVIVMIDIAVTSCL